MTLINHVNATCLEPVTRNDRRIIKPVLHANNQ